MKICHIEEVDNMISICKGEKKMELKKILVGLEGLKAKGSLDIDINFPIEKIVTDNDMGTKICKTLCGVGTLSKVYGVAESWAVKYNKSLSQNTPPKRGVLFK